MTLSNAVNASVRSRLKSGRRWRGHKRGARMAIAFPAAERHFTGSKLNCIHPGDNGTRSHFRSC